MVNSSNRMNRKMRTMTLHACCHLNSSSLISPLRNKDVTVNGEHYEQRAKMRQQLGMKKFYEVQTCSWSGEGHELSILFSSQQLITIPLIHSYNQIIEGMSFFYFFQAPANGLGSLQPIYYVPSECQQPATNLILVNATNPSQMEQKQNSILQSNMATRDSLPAQNDDRTKAAKKKKIAKKEKDESFGWRNQNKDRNILSNILKAFVNFLLEHEGMKNYLQSLISKLNFQNGVSGFHVLLEQNFPLSKSYISPKQLKTFLKGSPETEAFALILRLALKQFLKVEYYIILLKSSKIKRRSKMEQMKRCRELLALLFHQ